MLCQPFTQANDGQDRGSIQCFGKDAGVADIEVLDLGSQVFVEHLADSDGRAGVGAPKRADEDRIRIAAGPDQDLAGHDRGVVQPVAIAGGERLADPSLQADATVHRLMEELASTENRIAFAKQAYNDAVTRYNTTRASFPALVLAELFGFDATQLLQLENPIVREAPQVSLI